MISQQITSSQVRANLAEILDRVSENREIVTITRRNAADVANRIIFLQARYHYTED